MPWLTCHLKRRSIFFPAKLRRSPPPKMRPKASRRLSKSASRCSGENDSRCRAYGHKHYVIYSPGTLEGLLKKMNIEYRRKAFYRFLLIKKKEHSASILRNSAVRNSIFCRNSAVRNSIFCGSKFDILRFAVQPGCQGGQCHRQKTVPFWRSFIQASPLA